MTIGTRTSELFCLTLFGLCQWPDIQEYTLSFKGKPPTTRPAPSGESPLQIVHISDIHVDLSYETGANYNCTKNICCRAVRQLSYLYVFGIQPRDSWPTL
jgi:sphingomyelin phosphodiesterase